MWAWSKNGYGHSGHWTLKLAVSQEGINGINCFFLRANTNSEKLKVIVLIFGRPKNGLELLGHWTLKLVVSQE